MNSKPTRFVNAHLVYYLVLFIQLSLISSSFSQVTISGGSTVNGVYPSISSAITALNGAVISGPVNVAVVAGHSETAPSGGIEMTATGTAVNTILIFKMGGGANPKIISYTGGTGTPGSALQDGIFRLVGSDYVTIDGIDLEENNLNTTNPSTMEYGYSMFKSSTSNGCQFNTIKNCSITLSHLNNATSTLPAAEGSRAIQVVNSTAIAQTTSLVPISQAGANSNNKFYTNTINLCNYGIVLSGYAAPSPYILGDTLNDIGGNMSATGNTILNFGGAPAATNPAAAIRAINQWGVNISFNTINNNDGTHSNHVITFRGIYAQSGTSAFATINNNNIDLKMGATTSQLSFIENGIGTTPAGNTVNINNNHLTGNYLMATSGVFYGIYNISATAAVLNILNNTIENTTYSDNALAGSGANYLIYNTASSATMTVNIMDNIIQNHQRFGSTGSTTIGIFNSSGTGGMGVNIKRNSIMNLSIDGSGTTSTMYGIQTATGTIVVDSNIVRNLNCLKSTGTGVMYGIYNISSPVNENYNYNQVDNLIHNGTGTLYGIYAFSTTGVRTVRNNVIHTLSTGGTTISGIQQSSSVPSIFNNKIYNIESRSIGAPTVSGIMLTSSTAGTVQIYNNLIGDLRAPNANTSTATAPSIRGINFTTTTGSTTLAVSYNTILLNAMSSGVNFGTAGLFHTTSATATSATLNLNNNNIVNLSIPKGLGRTVAYQRSSTTITNFGSASDRNNLFAGGVCNERLIFFDGTNSDSTLAAYKARVTPRDANSVSESSHFLSLSGASNNFLHIDQTKPTLLESGAAPIAGITTDFDGDSRNGSTPDIGGDEFSGSTPTACGGTPVAGTISANPTSICSGQKTTLCVNGQSNTSGLSFQWKVSNNIGGPFNDILCAKDKCYMTDTLSTGTYYFQLTVTCDASGLSATTPTFTFTVNASPNITISPSAPSICVGSSVPLTASGAVSYSWAPSLGLNTTIGPNVIANPTATTTYTVTGTNASGCIGTSTVTISVLIAPIISSITASPNPICKSGSTQLNVNASLCSTPSTNVFAHQPNVTYNTLVGATNVIGTSNDDTPTGLLNIGFSFRYNCVDYTTMSISPDGWILFGAAGVSQFTNEITTATNIPKVYPFWDDLATGTDGFVRTLVEGVAPNRILKVEWFVTYPRNTTGPANSIFQCWMYETTNKIEFRYGVIGLSSTGYSIGLTGSPSLDFNCVNTITNTNSSTVAKDTNNTQMTANRFYSFSPLTITGYSWSPNTYLNNPNIQNPLASNVLGDITYTVSVSSSNGCSSTASINVVTGPNVNLTCTENSGNTPNDCTICNGATATLTASGGSSYSWSTGAITPSIMVTPSITTSYTVTVTDANNCTGTQSITVSVNANPIASISPVNPQICPGESVTLIGSGGPSYLWSTGATSSSIIVSPATNTTYALTVTNVNGCSAFASSTVTVKTGVTLSHTLVEPTTCISLNGSINLIVNTGIGPFSYNWFTPNGMGLVNGQEDQSGLSVGSYFVTVTSTNGCSGTRQINLVGPGNCSVCPTIGGLTKSVNSICKSSPFTLTATGLINMGNTYGITFKYSTTMLTGTQPYTMGSIIGTVPNGSLTMSGTQAVLNTASIPISGSVFLYAILSPTPTDPACRPSAANSINVTTCDVRISDPCSCLNNATTLTNGQFGETIKVVAPPGQIWTVTARTNLYTTTSPPPPAAPILVPIGTILTEMPINADSSMYILNARHVDAMGYTVTLSNGVFTTSIGNTCYYPNPTINNLNARYCVTDPAFTLLGSAQLGDGSGPAQGVGTFRVNGNITTTFNPPALGVGTHTVQYCFDAADGVPNGQHPGCNQCISQSVAIDGPPTITCPANLNVSCALDVPAPNPASVIINSNPCPSGVNVVHVSDVITNQTCANRYTLTRTYRATNPCCPNSAVTCTQTIIVNDVTSPSPLCPANQNLQCASAIPPVNTASVIVADGCGNAGIVVVHVSDTRVNQTCTNRFTLNRVYRATDVCGNSATCLQVFTVFDNTAPTLTCRNLTLYLNQNGTVVLTPATAVLIATDNCTPSAQLVFGASITNFTCANIGPNQVTISATDECLNNGTCLATITVLDTIAPVIMGCPVKSPVTLNLGPGACEISWDVPPFMAMDNCPGLGRFFGARNTTTVCLPPASYWSITGGAGSWGVMFDLINTSGSPLNLQILGERAFANVPHRIWYKTTPGGHAPVQGTPAAWTLCATRTPANGAQFTTIIDSFNLITGVVRDTMVSCTGTRIDSSSVGCLTMMPGETRGIYIHAPGTVGTNASLFDGCQPAQMGNAQITTPLNGATYTGGEFIAPFINSSFGFGGANWIGVIGYNLGAATNMVPLSQTCGAPYGPGCFFPIGCTRLCYEARDASGNIGRCEFEVCVNPYPNPITELACNDEIQISLDDSCIATIHPDMVLEGGPYSCYDDYIVTVRDWNTNALIDRLPNRPGIQVDRRDIGRHLRITITDPRTGNSCWGQATVEDKLAPILTCPPDITVACDEGTSPSVTGIPSVYENCGGVSLSYRDQSSQGSCELGYQNRIIRTWTAEDSYGNRSVCVQNIEESLGDLFSVTVPPNFDNLDQPILNCDEKIDRNKNIVPHMSDNPECVDGYLLDSAYWYARPNQLNIYPNRRIPRVLGWNCIDDPNDVHFGHPSPDPVYYPQHRSWQPNNPLCWGPDTHIMWIGTGRPGGTNSCNNLAVTYKDILFDLATAGCDAGPIGCYKVLRQWTVMDWCTSLVGGHSQIIKVGDLEGPQVLYPDSVRVNMDSYICAGRWEVSPPWLLDNCSNELHYSVEVEQGTVLGNETTGFVVIDMPEGIQNAWIVAEDCCGNITRKHLTINVVDRVPPTPICRSWTSVSINGNQSPLDNYARIYAEDLDEASYDNCAPHVYFKVIRMAELLGTNNGSNSNNTVACAGRNGDDNLILTGNQVYFDDYTDFCCADVGQRIMVVLRVFDIDPGAGPVTPVRMTSTTQPLHGRFSDCMVEVEVQNKAVPTVIAPPNIVVSCWFWFDINNLTNPNDETFGKVVTDLTLRRKVVTKDLVCRKYCERNDYTGYPGFVQSNANPKPAPNQACDYYFAYFDTAHWDRKYELTWGFDGYVLAPCGATPTITVNDLRECGQGIIQRIVSAQGPNNINVTAIQTIWVVDCDPFYIDDLTCNDPRFSDVIWPNGICTQTPVTLNGCGADISPDNPQLGRPQIINNADDNCALLSIEYRDEVFTIEPDACLKVLRTWTIIDWCQYDPFIDPDNGRWERLQVIKVRDQDRPVVTCNVGPCEPASIHPTLGVCVGHISLTASATDNCTPIDWLFWEYKIDAYNDRKGVHGGWDFRVGTLTEKQFNAGDTVEYSHNPFADNPRNPFNASGTYPIGIHRINWYVEDGCGNVGTCETLFEIRDCKAPTPYCLTGIISVPMPSSGCVSIWAKDLDKGSFDNCTSQDNLKFYFDNDPNKTSIEICCEDFVNAKVDDELILSVEMCVEDEEGNKDCCITTIVIQDNQDLCPNGGSFGKVTGNILTSTGNGTDETQVELKRAGNLMKEMVTSTDGKYAFYTLDMYQNYIVKPTRDDDHLNGVTTADIIRIQRHILGQDVISDPYLLIAADVNKSNSVTSADITEIRKLILGSISRFSKVPSWTFVPKDYVFANPAQPFQYEAYGSLKLDDPDMTLDFVSIKLGDVTNSARSNVNSKVSARTSSTLLLEFDDQILQAGQSYSIPVRSNNFHQIRGMQYTLRFDKQALQYLGTKGLALDISEPNTGINRIDDGILTMSWNQHQAISLSSQENLFELNITANQNGRLSEMIMINSDLTQAEAYNQNSEILNVSLLSRNGTTSSQTGIFELYQNEPNPFNKQTVIKYLLPTDGPVTLTVYDISGKVLRVIQQDAHKGLNQLIIQKSEIGRSGIYYYQLDANDHTDTRKLVIID